MENLWIIAQAAETQGQSEVPAEPVGQQTQTTIGTADSNAPGARAPAKGPLSDYSAWLFLPVMLLLFYFMIFRGPQKQKQQQQKMVQSIKKNDKVRTIGGIFGTVVDVKDDEIVLKVDESNNTKIRIMASAIGKNLSNEEK
jgi:preprotein translocase subunit YajC